MDIEKLIELFLEHLKAKGFSLATISTRRLALLNFLDFCNKNKIKNPDELKPVFLQRYMAYTLNRKRLDKTCNLSLSRKRVLLISLKLFVRFLYEKNFILNDPLTKVKIPSPEKNLPASFLTESQIGKILKVAKGTDAVGLRDRAILEMFYSSGLRRKELLNLKNEDVDFARETLWVKATKNHKDRMIPVGTSALKRLASYLKKGRPLFAKNIRGKDEGFIFLSRRGKRLSEIRLGELARDYRKKAGIKSKGACHIFRHAMATHMLKNGADIRYIQEILGHSSLSTTEIYTRVEISKLQGEYERVIS